MRQTSEVQKVCVDFLDSIMFHQIRSEEKHHRNNVSDNVAANVLRLLMGHISLIICSRASVLGGRRCWWRFSPIFHCFCCSFVMCPLGKGCLKCRREALTDIFSVCAGHLLLSTRPSVNPPLSHDRFTATSLSPDRVISPPTKKLH